jgi:hypothetical protein
MYSKCSFCEHYEVDMFCDIYPIKIPREIYFAGVDDMEGKECDSFKPILKEDD